MSWQIGIRRDSRTVGNGSGMAALATTVPFIGAYWGRCSTVSTIRQDVYKDGYDATDTVVHNRSRHATICTLQKRKDQGHKAVLGHYGVTNTARAGK